MSDMEPKPKGHDDHLPRMRTPSGRWVYDPGQAEDAGVDPAALRELLEEATRIEESDARDVVPEAVEAPAAEGGAILATGSDAARAHAIARLAPAGSPVLPSAPIRISEKADPRRQATVRVKKGGAEERGEPQEERGENGGPARTNAHRGSRSGEEARSEAAPKDVLKRRGLVALGAVALLVLGTLAAGLPWGRAPSGQSGAGGATTGTATTGDATAGATGSEPVVAGATTAAPDSSDSNTRGEQDSVAVPRGSGEPSPAAAPGGGGAATGEGTTVSPPAPSVGATPAGVHDPYADASAPNGPAAPRGTATVSTPAATSPGGEATATGKAGPAPSASTPGGGSGTQPSPSPTVKPVEGDRVFGR